MLNKTYGSIVSAIALLISSNAVLAQEKPASFSVTPYIGGYLFDNEQKFDNDAVYGVSLGYNYTNNYGVEASVEYIRTNYELAGADSRSTRVGNYRVDGIYNLFTNSRLVPFVFAGLGVQNVNNPKNDPTNRRASAADYGAGLKFFLNDRLALRGDVRQVYIFDNSLKDFEYTLGLSFYFGGAKPARVSRYEQIEDRPLPEPIINEPKAKPLPEPLPEPIMYDRKVVAEKAVKAPEPESEEKKSVVVMLSGPTVAEKVVVIMVAEPEVEEKLSNAATEPEIIVLAFEDVHFDFDESSLKPEARTILKNNVRILADNPEAEIRIAGYTSASGTEDYNQKLSERRANAVQEYLIAEGITTPDRLSTIGYGETKPEMYEAAPKEIYSNAAKANMRVLFEIIVR